MTHRLVSSLPLTSGVRVNILPMPRINAYRHRGLIAVIASMVIVNLVYGLTLPLLSLVLDAQGISKTVIGLSIVAQACAGVVIAPFASRLIQRMGAARGMVSDALHARRSRGHSLVGERNRYQRTGR
jgi:hypothetical protein